MKTMLGGFGDERRCTAVSDAEGVSDISVASNHIYRIITFIALILIEITLIPRGVILLYDLIAVNVTEAAGLDAQCGRAF
jgi:hypothetical protein